MVRGVYISQPILLTKSLSIHTTSDKIKLAQLTSLLFYIITADILNTETLSERTFTSSLPSSPSARQHQVPFESEPLRKAFSTTMNSTLISSCLYLQQFTTHEHPLDTQFHPSWQILVASIIMEGDCLVNPPLQLFSTNFNPFLSRPPLCLGVFRRPSKKSYVRSGVRRDTMIRWL